ncbi:MAG: energy-coupled thiamine transporter ThiT [Clostridiales bacterium]|nr:energy-coupled thiamine transporter ThiT [Clostridiales bacterium]
MNNNSKTRILTEGAVMIAMATILSYIKIFELPYGGSITLEMIPLIIMSCRHDTQWGLLTALVHGLLQMITGIQNVFYCPTLLSQLGCILLDYLLGFGVLGLAGAVSRALKGGVKGIITGCCFACVLRYACSFLSGVLLWAEYTPEGMSPAFYSAVYNGSYMLPDTIIVVIVWLLLYRLNPKLYKA